MTKCECQLEPEEGIQSRLLVTLLVVNALMFLLEMVIGWLAESTALLADSLDMLADATVYAIALLAVGRSDRFKMRAAFSSGIFQLLLAGSKSSAMPNRASREKSSPTKARLHASYL
jgi:Co/Zn/Cd efflux system component